MSAAWQDKLQQVQNVGIQTERRYASDIVVVQVLQAAHSDFVSCVIVIISLKFEFKMRVAAKV
jgi:hypothetical protein